jgi:hypothetical protein
MDNRGNGEYKKDCCTRIFGVIDELVEEDDGD